MSVIKRAEFVSAGMSYIVLKGHWCSIIVLNVHSPSKEKIDDAKVLSGIREVFDHFPKYRTKIPLGDFNAK